MDSSPTGVCGILAQEQWTEKQVPIVLIPPDINKSFNLTPLDEELDM